MDQLVDESQVITGWCRESDEEGCPEGCQPIPEYPDLPPLPLQRVNVSNQNVSVCQAVQGRNIAVTQEYNSLAMTVTVYDMDNANIVAISGGEWKEDAIPRRHSPHKGFYVDDTNLYYIVSVGLNTVYNSATYATLYVTMNLDTYTKTYEYVLDADKIVGSCSGLNLNDAFGIYVLSKSRWFISSSGIKDAGGYNRKGMTMLDVGSMHLPTTYLQAPNSNDHYEYVHGYIYRFLMSAYSGAAGKETTILDTQGNFVQFVKDIDGSDLMHISSISEISNSDALVSVSEFGTDNTRVFLMRNHQLVFEYVAPDNNQSGFGARTSGYYLFSSPMQYGNFVLIGQTTLTFEGITNVGTIHWYNYLTGELIKSESAWGNPPNKTNDKRGIDVMYNGDYYGWIYKSRNMIEFIKAR